MTRPPTTSPTTTSTAPTTAAAPATSAPASTPPTSAPAKPLDTTRRYAVGTRTLTFEDTSRTTSANGEFGGAPTRTLPTEFWYPAQGAAGGGPVADAAPDKGNGPYPLVLFAHGYDVTPDFYAPAARALGRRGLRGRGTGVPDPQRLATAAPATSTTRRRSATRRS